jgi:hypothetical protein
MVIAALSGWTSEQKHAVAASLLGCRDIDCLERLGPGQILFVRPTESDVHMNERLETLKKARERMADDRDTFAKTLAAPFDRDKAERARIKFIETQILIDAIDRAIEGEQTPPAAV